MNLAELAIRYTLIQLKEKGDKFRLYTDGTTPPLVTAFSTNLTKDAGQVNDHTPNITIRLSEWSDPRSPRLLSVRCNWVEHGDWPFTDKKKSSVVRVNVQDSNLVQNTATVHLGNPIDIIQNLGTHYPVLPPGEGMTFREAKKEYIDKVVADVEAPLVLAFVRLVTFAQI